MMRLTPLSLAANTVFFLILAVMYCRVLTRRFSWPFTLLGLTVGYLLYIIPTKFMPYADAERMLFGLVTFPLTPIVLFRDKWYKSLLCAFAGLVAMAGSDLLSVSWLLTPEQLRQGLTFQPIPVQLAVYAIFLSTDGLLMFLFTLLMNRYQNRLSGREWALYLAFPASQYLLIYGWVIFLRTDFILRRVLMLLLALAICTAADALLFTAIRGMAQRGELKARNVGVSVHFIALHTMSAYAKRFGYKPEDFPKAYAFSESEISLPLYSTLGVKNAEYVADAVLDVVKKYRK